jgi:hypothetical protein
VRLLRYVLDEARRLGAACDLLARRISISWELHVTRPRFGPVMPTPKEFRKNADDCLKLARETTEIYASMALIEMATEFRVIAELRARRDAPNGRQN